eukprot:3597596-Rhodomonas_salina.4
MFRFEGVHCMCIGTFPYACLQVTRVPGYPSMHTRVPGTRVPSALCGQQYYLGTANSANTKSHD